MQVPDAEKIFERQATVKNTIPGESIRWQQRLPVNSNSRLPERAGFWKPEVCQIDNPLHIAPGMRVIQGSLLVNGLRPRATADRNSLCYTRIVWEATEAGPPAMQHVQRGCI
jgi:hypothetical protein